MKLNPDNFKISHIIIVVLGFFLLGIWFINQPVQANSVDPILEKLNKTYASAAISSNTASQQVIEAQKQDSDNLMTLCDAWRALSAYKDLMKISQDGTVPSRCSTNNSF